MKKSNFNYNLTQISIFIFSCARIGDDFVESIKVF